MEWGLLEASGSLQHTTAADVFIAGAVLTGQSWLSGY